MATALLKCRVCGKSYEACRNAKRVDGVFRWQDVACSIEHGAEYLAAVRAARGQAQRAVETVPVKAVVAEDAEAIFEAEYDEESEDEFVEDDDEDEDLEIEV